MTAPSLALLDATLATLDAAIDDPPALPALLGASVADDWAGFPESLPHLREALRAHPQSPWGTVFFLLEQPRTLAGMGGYKGEPSADGIVEIGYAIAPSLRGQGLATLAARALLVRAFSDVRVLAVDAHTLGHVNPSTRVLTKLGFQRIGEQAHPTHGSTWHWRVERARFYA